MNKIICAAILALSLSGCVIHMGDRTASGGEDASSTLGNIDVADGQHAGQLETVNGNVTIGSNAKVRGVEVVNGNIKLGDFSQAKSLETVNGNIEAGADVHIAGEVETVNGNIKFGERASIGGSLETASGSMFLAQDSRVEGDIVFEKSGNWGDDNNKQPKLELAQGVTVNGQIHLHQPVKLQLPDSVDPGKVVRHYSDE